MASMSAGLIDALARVPGLLEAALAPTDRSGRAARLAGALCALWPGAQCYACRLGTVTSAAAVDADGKPLPVPAALGDGQGEAPEPGLQMTPLAVAGRRYGAVGLTAPAEDTEARALLNDFADRLAWRLYAEEARERLDRAERDLAEQTRSGDVAEAFGVFVHELGNVLNNLVLDARLLEPHVTHGGRGRLAQLNRLAGGVPKMLGHMYRFRQGRRTPPGPVDLNRITAEVMEAFGPDGAAVHAELAPGLPPVEATPGGLSRLVRLLLGHALAVTPPPAGPVRVRTEHQGEHVRLTVEDGGPPVAPEALPHLFEPFAAPRHGQSNLELAICKTLVRRLQGKLEGFNRPAGGVAFVADLPIHGHQPAPPG